MTWEEAVYSAWISQKSISSQKYLFCRITVEYFAVIYKCYIDYKIKRIVLFQQQQKGTLSHMQIAFSFLQSKSTYPWWRNTNHSQNKPAKTKKHRQRGHKVNLDPGSTRACLDALVSITLFIKILKVMNDL